MQTDKYYLCKDLIGNIDSLTSSAKQTIDSIEAYNENSKNRCHSKILYIHKRKYHFNSSGCR